MSNKMSRVNWRAIWSTVRLGYLAALMNRKLPSGITISSSTSMNDSSHFLNDHSTSFSMRSYKAGGTATFPIIVLHGLTRQGFDDHRLVNFAHVLAATGFEVFTPNLPNLQNLKFDFGDIETISTTLSIASQQGKRAVGVIGFSVGATYGLIASGIAPVKDRISFVLAAGGYWSMAKVVEQSFTTAEPDPYPILVMDWNVIDKLGLNENEVILYREIMNNYCAKEGCFTTEETGLINKILHHPKQQEVLQWWREHLPNLDALSLAGNNYLNLTEAEILLLHGKNDHLIPLTETFAILHELQNCGRQFRYCLSGNPGHMDYLKGNLTGLFGLFYRMMELRG